MIFDELASKTETLEKVFRDCSRLQDCTSRLHCELEVQMLRTKTLRAPGHHNRSHGQAIPESGAKFLISRRSMGKPTGFTFDPPGYSEA